MNERFCVGVSVCVCVCERVCVLGCNSMWEQLTCLGVNVQHVSHCVTVCHVGTTLARDFEFVLSNFNVSLLIMLYYHCVTRSYSTIHVIYG